METVRIVTNNFIIDTLPNDWCGLSMYNSGGWEPHITEFLKKNLKKDSVFVDIGSNYGWHSISSSFHCNLVYSFEPQKYIYSIQKNSITENNILNIEIHNCGIGDKNEKKEMSLIDYENPSINMGDLSIGFGGESIEVRTLDSFQIPKIDFMKIDVQGYEKYVLEGAKKSILSSKPTIVIEMEDHQLRRFGYGVVELFEQLKNLGYYIYFLDYHYPSDHVCVHIDNLSQFTENNREFIKPLTETNNLNNNLENGVTEKISYEKN